MAGDESDLPKNIEKKSWWDFCNRPLIVVAFSSLIFGGAVAFLGSRFQYAALEKLQSTSRQKALDDKLFDKRAEIITSVFFEMERQEYNVWDRFRTWSSVNAALSQEKNKVALDIAEDFKRWDEIDKDIALKNAVLIEEIKIYLNMEDHRSFLYNYKGIMDQLRDLALNIDEKKGISRNELETKIENINMHKKDMHLIANKIVYNLKMIK